MAKQKQTRVEAKSFGGTIEATREERMVPIHGGESELELNGMKITIVDANGSVASVWLMPGEARELARLVRM